MLLSFQRAFYVCTYVHVYVFRFVLCSYCTIYFIKFFFLMCMGLAVYNTIDQCTLDYNLVYIVRLQWT